MTSRDRAEVARPGLPDNDAWCAYPWSDMSSGTGETYKLCPWSEPLPYRISNVSPLQHWNSPDMRKIRLSMLRGDAAAVQPFCGGCQIQERAGIDSPRRRRLREMNDDAAYRDAVVAAVHETTTKGDGSAPADAFRVIDLRVVGNLCNLRCVMCSPQSSSAIAHELKRTGRLPADAPTRTLPLHDMDATMRKRFWQELATILPRTRCLYFAGGEPFLSDAHYDVLDLAIRLDLTDRLELLYSTNLTSLTTPSGRAILPYLKRFRRVHLHVSVDNLHAKNDYIRHGSKFAALLDNMHRVARECPHVQIEPTTCVSMLNVLDLPAIRAFFRPMFPAHSFVNLLVHPTHLRATNLPPALRDLARRRLAAGGETFRRHVDWIEEPVSPAQQASEFARFVAHVTEIDAARGTSFVDVFPEYAPHLAPRGDSKDPHR